MIRKLNGMDMTIAADARIAENATLVGQLTIESKASIWYGAVLRGDSGHIVVGENCAIEDNVILHNHAVLGKNVVVGHNAIVHGCTVEDDCLIGMGAIVMNGAVIGRGSLVAAGSLVKKGMIVPPDSLVMGAPAKVVGPLNESQQEYVRSSAEEYLRLSALQLPLWEEIDKN